ncbi:MAG: ATPase, T2SS/T4P/T4SS family [Clostridia bacterium]
MKNVRIGDVLKQYGYVSDEQIAEALAHQKSHPEMRLGAIFLALGYVTEKQLLEALSARMELPMLDLTTARIDSAAVERIPRQIADKYCLIAVSENGTHLMVAMDDPLDFYAIEDVRQITQMLVDVVLDLKSNIENAIELYYSEISAKDAARLANESVGVDTSVFDAEDAGIGDDAPVVQVLNSLLVRGYSVNASDIHIEPFENNIAIRMRVDGVITDYVTLSKSLLTSLVARVKILSNLDIGERRLPQDGHFKTMVSGLEMNTRVSIIPTVFGEKVVIRFLSTNVKIDHGATFGMTSEDYTKLNRVLESPHGIVYITGPTGSGKTTTLYLVLEALSRRLVNISTIEDPVERNIPRINQVQVNNTAGLTFETGLRSLLRQDPDIIMVGETRDSETAGISIRAAITGHLVLSTLHTNDAISSIVRLRDMGVPSYLVANSLVGLVAQRLMRKVCPYCAVAYEPGTEEIAILGTAVKTLHKGTGCHQCNNTGYKGRIAVHEIVTIDKTLRRMIVEDSSMDEIIDYIKKTQNFISLRDSALALVESGVSTVAEFQKIAYYAD